MGKKLIEEFKASGLPEEVVINPEMILRAVGLVTVGQDGDMKYTSLTSLPIGEIVLMIQKSIRFMEVVSEAHAIAAKREADLGDKINQKESELMVGQLNGGKKVTDAREIAKSDPELLNMRQRRNTLKAYVGYLDNFLGILNHYQFVLKGRQGAIERETANGRSMPL